jgi:hypothetical protein
MLGNHVDVAQQEKTFGKRVVSVYVECVPKEHKQNKAGATT